MSKPYVCCICHKILEDKKPIRLVKQIYGKGRYNQYGTVTHYDFCEECYKTFDKWLSKHKKEEV